MEEREIGEADEGARQRILVAVRIDLEDRIARLAGRPLRDDRELDEALLALVAVEIVVIIAGPRGIFEVRAAAEPLDPVVRAVVDLDLMERSERRRVGVEGVSTCRFRGAP